MRILFTLGSSDWSAQCEKFILPTPYYISFTEMLRGIQIGNAIELSLNEKREINPRRHRKEET